MLHGSSRQISSKIQSNCHSGCGNKKSCHSILPQRAGGWGYCRSVPSPSAHSPLAPAVLTRAAAAAAAVCVRVHVFVRTFGKISSVVVLAIQHHTCRSLRNYSVTSLLVHTKLTRGIITPQSSVISATQFDQSFHTYDSARTMKLAARNSSYQNIHSGSLPRPKLCNVYEYPILQIKYSCKLNIIIDCKHMNSDCAAIYIWKT